jgi:hypothetical protein
MAFGYIRPFSFKIGAQQAAVQVAAVRHGVTEITLSDGRLVRATLHVRDVKPNPQRPGTVDISYNIVAEVMPVPSAPIHDVHETVQ